MSIQLTWEQIYSIGSWVMEGPMSVLHEQDTNGATLGWLTASARWSKKWPFHSSTHETWVLLKKEAFDGVDKELVPDFLLRYAKWDIKRNKSKCLTENTIELLIEIKYYNITKTTAERLEEFFSQVSLFSNPVIDNNLELLQRDNESIEKEPLFSEISFSTNTCNHNISWLPCTKNKLLDDIWWRMQVSIATLIDV
jgi:hypothetical protein